jgi:membrane dipeptidase
MRSVSAALLPSLLLGASLALAPSLPLGAGSPLAAQQPTRGVASAADPHLVRARRILRTTPLVDTHNDLPWAIREDSGARMDIEKYNLRQRTRGHTDVERLRRGMVGAQFWSVYIPGEIRDSGFARVQLEQIDIARRVVAKYPDVFEWALTAADVRRVFARGKIGSLLGLEGGHAIENSLGALRVYYELGARYMTLTHNVTLDWADAAQDSAKHGGLTRFGEEVVREMNRLGMLVDLSHVSPATMSDALNVTEAPVIFSHSSARAIADVPRNVPDSILARVKQNGGVVMVTFVTGFISPEVVSYGRRTQARMGELRAQYPSDTSAIRREMGAWRQANPAPKVVLSQVADHIEHIRKIIGVDHVGLGGDFDGISEVITGLEDVSTYPALIAELSRRGWTDVELRKVAGENVLRAMARAEAVAARLQKTRAPSTRTIAELDGPRR